MLRITTSSRKAGSNPTADLFEAIRKMRVNIWHRPVKHLFYVLFNQYYILCEALKSTPKTLSLFCWSSNRMKQGFCFIARPSFEFINSAIVHDEVKYFGLLYL